MHGADVLVLFHIPPTRQLVICSADQPLNPLPGSLLVSLAAPKANETEDSLAASSSTAMSEQETSSHNTPRRPIQPE